MNLIDHRATVLVHIQSYEDSVPKGAFITLPLQEKYEFRGLDQLLLILEDLMDAAAGPETGGEHRYLYQDRAPYVFLEPGLSWMEKEPGLPPALPRGRAAFTIQVSYRQHASMQGRLSYRTGQEYQTVSFRSALELMRMLHEYLSRETASAGKKASGAGPVSAGKSAAAGTAPAAKRAGV